jgi:hypothetical protein
MWAARTYCPSKRLWVAEQPIRDIDLGDDLVSLLVSCTDDVDGRKKCRYHGEKAPVGDVSTGAHPSPEAKARCAWVTYSRIWLAVGGEVAVGVECLRLGIVFGVVQDAPGEWLKTFKGSIGEETDQAEPMMMDPFGIR